MKWRNKELIEMEIGKILNKTGLIELWFGYLAEFESISFTFSS